LKKTHRHHGCFTGRCRRPGSGRSPSTRCRSRAPPGRGPHRLSATTTGSRRRGTSLFCCHHRQPPSGHPAAGKPPLGDPHDSPAISPRVSPHIPTRNYPPGRAPVSPRRRTLSPPPACRATLVPPGCLGHWPLGCQASWAHLAARPRRHPTASGRNCGPVLCRPGNCFLFLSNTIKLFKVQKFVENTILLGKR
jgi:hypothetical protein